MTTKKRAGSRVAAKPASKKPVPTSLFSLTSQGLDRLRARVNAAPSNGAAEASVTSAPKKKRILDALARLEADFERVLSPAASAEASTPKARGAKSGKTNADVESGP